MLTVDPNDIVFVGKGLSRPECVLTTRTGDLFVSDQRGGISWITPSGQTKFIEAKDRPEGFLPNGIALMPNRDIMIANLGSASGVWRMALDGTLKLEISEIDGRTLPPVNFVGLDREQRLWITVSTLQVPREKAFRKGWADGFIAVDDGHGPRIVAEGLGYTNEAIVDPTGQWLYVNETIARRTVRFPITPGASLGPMEIIAEYPPATFPDGLTFDAEGGVWIVSVSSNRIYRVDPGGEIQLILEDADQEALGGIALAFEQDRFGRTEIDAGKARVLGNLASIAFGGDDLKTVYLGSLHSTQIGTFRSPIAGAAPVHWEF